MTENLYTTSRIKTIRSCLRLHRYRYVLGIAGASNASARFGTVGHAGLEAWLLAAGDVRLAAALAAVASSDLDAWERARLDALLVGYDTRYAGVRWEVLEVEREFRYELGGYLIGGKIDAIVRDLEDGRIYVVEHKTTGTDASPGSSYWEKLAIDTQVSVYVDGATMLGYDIAGVIYDVIIRPRHEPKLATPVDARKFTKGKGCKGCGGRAGGKGGVVQGAGCETCAGTGWLEAPRLHEGQRDTDEDVDAFLGRVAAAIGENPDAFYHRATVVRLEDELPKMRNDLLDAIKLERLAAAVDLAPRNPDACARYGSMCPFFDACAGRADIDDPIRFPRSGAHPELAATH